MYFLKFCSCDSVFTLHLLAMSSKDETHGVRMVLLLLLSGHCFLISLDIFLVLYFRRTDKGQKHTCPVILTITLVQRQQV